MFFHVKTIDMNLLQQHSPGNARQATRGFNRRSPYLVPADYENIRRSAFAHLSKLVQQDYFVETALVRFLIPYQILRPGRDFCTRKLRRRMAALRNIHEPYALAPGIEAGCKRNDVGGPFDSRAFK